MRPPSTSLLSHCTTVWLQADPEDHMKRVLAQGDLWPMAASKQAEDLKNILSGHAFYSEGTASGEHQRKPARPNLSTYCAVLSDRRFSCLSEG
jgi:XRE family aerobic/anaerobic benzoate catabolism transcriptional regulator